MDTDNNYPPGDFADRLGDSFGPLLLAPVRDGADYDDIFKVSHCSGCTFNEITVSAGQQKENAIDLNRESYANLFNGLKLDGGKQGAILIKGGSCGNIFNDVLITNASGHSDVMIGGYSGQSKKTSRGNRFVGIRRIDGKPVRYAYTFTRAEKPIFVDSNVKFQFWWSLVRTIAQEFSYLTSK
jgi:hypothetical protein